jgi:hypothetical protein
VDTTRDDRAMAGLRNLALAGLLLLAVAASANAGTQARLPAPLAADCGSGVTGAGFTAYPCGDGDGGTKYAHPSELLVLRTNGRYAGFHDSISEPNLMARSTTGEVVAAHNDAIVRVTASALKTLVSQRQLDELFPGSPGLAAINAITVTAPGAVLFRVNYYASHKHGCGNILAELTASGRVKVLWRSATGLICG